MQQLALAWSKALQALRCWLSPPLKGERPTPPHVDALLDRIGRHEREQREARYRKQRASGMSHRQAREAERDRALGVARELLDIADDLDRRAKERKSNDE